MSERLVENSAWLLVLHLCFFSSARTLADAVFLEASREFFWEISLQQFHLTIVGCSRVFVLGVSFLTCLWSDNVRKPLFVDPKMVDATGCKFHFGFQATKICDMLN